MGAVKPCPGGYLLVLDGQSLTRMSVDFVQPKQHLFR